MECEACGVETYLLFEHDSLCLCGECWEEAALPPPIKIPSE